jgi:hypothetical protein
VAWHVVERGEQLARFANRVCAERRLQQMRHLEDECSHRSRTRLGRCASRCVRHRAAPRRRRASAPR